MSKPLPSPPLAAVSFALAIATAAAAPTTAAAADPAAGAGLSEADFERLCTALRPSEDEPWRTVPWKIDLLDARAAAAEERKPIFIWAMDGHPLGCT